MPINRLRLFVLCTSSATVLASGFAPWLRLLRTDFSGYGMARLVVVAGDEYPVVPPSWIGLTWYLLPATAATAWIVAFARSPALVRPTQRPLARRAVTI